MTQLTEEMRARLSDDFNTKMRGDDMRHAETVGEALQFLCFASRVLRANGVDPIEALKLFEPK